MKKTEQRAKFKTHFEDKQVHLLHSLAIHVHMSITFVLTHPGTLIISMLKTLVTSDQLPLDILTVAKLTNQASHVSQY